MNSNTLTPWYKQFWPWFVISIPAITVVAGISMILIASHEADTVVVDDYYKSGLAINKTLARDKRALALGQRARISIVAADKRVVVTLSGREHPKDLVLSLTHPTATQQDLTIKLQQQNNKQKYSGTLANLPKGKRYLLLEPLDQSWRLVGNSIFPSKEDIELSPDL